VHVKVLHRDKAFSKHSKDSGVNRGGRGEKERLKERESERERDLCRKKNYLCRTEGQW